MNDRLHQALLPASACDTRGLRQPPAGTAAAVNAGTLHVTSARLFAGNAEVQIEHNGSVYRLKQTSLGKLILTK